MAPSSSSSSSPPLNAPLPLSKLTPSCGRCRSKKLKCRYPDSNSTSCFVCIEKGLGNECRRDVRIARGKRRKGSDAGEVDLMSKSIARLNNVEAASRRVEIRSLQKRIEELERMDAIFQQNEKALPSPSISESNTQTNTLSETHQSSPYGRVVQRMSGKQKETEDAAKLLEEFAQNHRRGGLSKDAEKSTISRDTAQTKWRKLTTLSERLELIRAAKECPIASDAVVVRELVSVYLFRVNHIAGHVIYAPGYQRAVEAFLSMSVEEIVMSNIFVDPCCLSTMMLVLCLGFEFHPRQAVPDRPPSTGFLAVQSIRQRNLDPTQRWYSIARQSLAVEDSYHLDSIPALQAACLILARGQESEGWIRMLHQVAISSARDFGLHKLGKAEADSKMEKQEFIRLECGVRIWNFLIMRDWSLASEHGHILLVSPNQTTTRRPLNIDDEDLDQGQQKEKPRSQWTMMSFVIAQLELSEVIRDRVLMKLSPSTLDEERFHDHFMGQDDDDDKDHNQVLYLTHYRQSCQQKLDSFVRNLPPSFALHSQDNIPGLIPVQRWLLHQQVFDLQLRLRRAELTSPKGRTSCLELAENILRNQAMIRAICPIIDKLQVHFFHFFGACMVVLLDLIQKRGDEHNQADQNRRYEARATIIDSMQFFQDNQKYHRGMRVLEIMLESEKKSKDSPQSISLSTIVERIIKETQTTEKETTDEEHSHVWPALFPQNPIPDHSMLPLVGAWRREGDHHLSDHQRAKFAITKTSQTWQATISVHQNPPLCSDQQVNTNDNLYNHGPIFDWALGLGFDPFEGHHNSQISVGTHQPTSSHNLTTSSYSSLRNQHDAISFLSIPVEQV